MQADVRRRIPAHLTTLMTDRLYYSDSYLTSFSAVVVAVASASNLVYLDRSAFYPASGGQPHDVGTINGVPVIDVIDEGERVAHATLGVSDLCVGDVVNCVVDEARRDDFMQQHTGQHVISAVCSDDHSWETLSVHFGGEYCTVDVSAAAVDDSQLRAIEHRVNEIVLANLPVAVTYEEAERAQGLRKPSNRIGELRIVSIEGVDRSACGGTHVARTGEVGPVLLRGVEKMKGASRIRFLCGWRALKRARMDAEILSRASRLLSSAPDEVGELIEQQQTRLTELEREQKRLLVEITRHKARGLWGDCPADSDGFRRVRIKKESGFVREEEQLARQIVELGHCIVLLTVNEPAGVMVATSPDTDVDAGKVLKAALQTVGGRGGGSARLAQGSTPVRTIFADLESALGFRTSTINDPPPASINEQHTNA